MSSSPPTARWLPLVAATACVALLSACGREDERSPLAPSYAPPVLQIGDYELRLSGFFCAGVVPPFPLTGPAPVSSLIARARVTVSRDGSAWIVRSSTADDGDFSMRLSEVYVYPDRNAVTGTLSGRAVDQRGFASSGPLTSEVVSASGGEVPTTGSLKTTTPSFIYDTLGVGSGTGQFSQASRDGVVTCQQFAWAIHPRLD